MLNSFTATARVVADPEIKETGSTKIATMRVVNSTNKKKKGEWVENPFFFRVVAFGTSADNLMRYRKGDLVAVSGELACETYGDDKKQAFNLNLNKIENLSPKKEAAAKGDDMDIDFDGDDMPN